MIATTCEMQAAAVRRVTAKRSVVAVVCFTVVVATISAAKVPAFEAASVAQAVDGGQPAAAFSVVSVRPTAPSSTEQRGIRPIGAGGRFRAVGMTLRDLIRVAYGSQAALLPSQIVGGPKWAESAAFDIETGVDDTAATGGQMTTERLFAMLRTLLSDSFKLRLHSEARELPIYELVLARQGRLGGTLMPTTTPCVSVTSGAASNAAAGVPLCGFRRVSPTNLAGTGVTMELLAGVLASVPDVGRPVRDRTGLKGGFDLDVTFAPLAAVGQPAVGPTAPDGAPQLFTALQEQLGLRLQNSRGLVDVFVIDSAEIPPSN